MKLKFKEILPEQKKEIETVSVLAKSILHEFYGPQMPKHHINYFLEEFQSTEAIKKQLESSWKYYLIELNSVAIGYMGISIEGKKMILSKLYVLANQRNMGAGKSAMILIDSVAKKGGIEELELRVNQMNIRAIKFYKNYGFKVVDDISTSYNSGHTEHDYIMIKKILD